MIVRQCVSAALCIFAIGSAQVFSDSPKIAVKDGPIAQPAGDAKAPATSPETHNAALSAQVNEAFNLAASRIVSLDAPHEPEIAFATVIPVDEELWTLDLKPHSVRSPHYRLLVQVEGGEIVEHEPGPVRTMRGEVFELEGSQVAASILDTGLQALILMPDGSRQWLEPVASKIEGAEPDLYVLYGDEDVIAEGGACGVEEALGLPDVQGAAPRGGPACGANMCEAELANDCDFQFFQDYGSIANTEARVDSVVNTVNMQYESQTQISHVITATLVRSTEPDPYSDENPISYNTLLSQFRSHWLAQQDGIQRDVAQLFSGKEFSGSVIGVAWGIGEICTDGAYCVNQSDFNGSFNCSTDLHAHELGHLWGAFHCDCPNKTMNPSITCANSFASVSINSIESHRDSRTCLVAPESTLTPTPFFEDFPSTTLDESKWTGIDGAAVNTSGTSEPSGTLSLNLDGNATTGGDQLRSAVMDLSPGINTPLEYWYQRTGGGNSPEAGDDLVVEYRNFVGTWIETNRHLGSGPDMTTYEFVSIDLPTGAQHADFRVRFRVESSDQGNDDWFIDDVDIDMGDVFPPAPNPMTFAVLPPIPVSDTQIRFEATIATDDFSGVQYYFKKEFGPGCCGGDSGWVNSPIHVASGLRANASHSYKVKARDTSQNLNQTGLSAAFGTTSTQIETPFEIVLIDAQETSLTVMVTCEDLGQTNRCNGAAFTDLTLLPSGLFLELTPQEGSGSGVWVNDQTILLTDLSPGTEYAFRAKARNRLAVETPFSGVFFFSTIGAPTECPNLIAGDINQDGMVGGDDVAGYLRAKLGQPPLPGESQGCADFGTGTLDGDTAAFVDAMLQ